MDIESRDLFLGSGGDENKPDLSKVTFQQEKKGGYSTKYEVIDGSGKKWIVKEGSLHKNYARANRLDSALAIALERSADQRCVSRRQLQPRTD